MMFGPRHYKENEGNEKLTYMYNLYTRKMCTFKYFKKYKNLETGIKETVLRNMQRKELITLLKPLILILVICVILRPWRCSQNTIFLTWTFIVSITVTWSTCTGMFIEQNVIGTSHCMAKLYCTWNTQTTAFDPYLILLLLLMTFTFIK